MKSRWPALAALPLAAALLAGCSGSAGPDSASESPSGDPGSDSKVMRIATDATHPPHDFLDENGKLVGWENELMLAVGERMGYEVEYSTVSFDALIPGLESDRYDVVFANMGITPERLAVVDMITAFEGGQAFLGNEANGIRIDGLEDLCGVSIGVTRGSTQADLVEQQSAKCVANGEPAVEIMPFQSGDQIILAVESNRVEIYWTAQPIASHYSMQPGSVLEIAGLVPDTRNNTAIALQKDSELTEPMRDALQSLIDDGTYQSILDEWNLSDNAIEVAEIRRG